MKSTNTERDDIFDLRISTNSVKARDFDYGIDRSWLDDETIEDATHGVERPYVVL